jgi:hypothetical protein
MKRNKFLWLMLCAGHCLVAQTRVDLRTQSKSPDLSATGATSTFQTGISLPGSCTGGESYFLTTASPGENLFICAAVNSWSQIKSGSSGGGGVRISSGATDSLSASDNGLNVVYTAAGSVSAILPQPGAAIGPTWMVFIFNNADGTVSLTPVSSTIDGSSSISVQPLQGLSIWSDGANYHTSGTVLQPGSGIQMTNRSVSADTSVMLSVTDFQNGVPLRCFPNSGSATAFTCSTPVVFASYANGMRLNWQPDVACGTATTLAVNGLPAIPVTESGGNALKAGDCDTARKNLTLAYNSLLPGSPYWEIVSGGAAGTASQSLPATVVQTNQNNRFTSGTQDSSAAQHTLPAATGTQVAIPATCAVGEMYFSTDAAPGQNISYCTAANTWSRAAGGTGTAARRGSIQFSTMGFNGAGLGPYINWVSYGAAPGGSAVADVFPFATFPNTSSPVALYNFVWPADFDPTGHVDVTLGFADGSYVGGNVKFDVSFACVAAGTGLGSQLIYGHPASTGLVSAGTGNALITPVIASVDITTPSCAADELASLRVSRDTSITGQSGSIPMIRVSLTYSRVL